MLLDKIFVFYRRVKVRGIRCYVELHITPDLLFSCRELVVLYFHFENISHNNSRKRQAACVLNFRMDPYIMCILNRGISTNLFAEYLQYLRELVKTIS